MANEGADDYKPDAAKEEAFERLSRQIKASQQKHESGIVELTLRPKLQETNMVENYSIRGDNIEILLNHVYDGVRIVFTVNRKVWQKNHDILETLLKKKGVTKKQHIGLLTDVLDDNYQTILEIGNNDNNNGNSKNGSAATITTSTSAGMGIGIEDDEQQEESPAQIALRLVEEHCSQLFVDQFGIPYAAVMMDNNNRVETLQLKSSRFRNWLCMTYYRAEDNVLGGETVTNVLNVLTARAEFDNGSDMKNLSLRVATLAEEPFTIYYDLTNRNWEIVKITDEGWSVISSKDAPILFRRFKNQIPQTYPSKSKEYPKDIFDKFIGLINISKGKTLEGIYKRQRVQSCF